MKEKGHLASKRNFARRNERSLGPREQAEDTNKIDKIKIKCLWLRLWGPPKIHWPPPGSPGPRAMNRLNPSLIGTRKAKTFIASVIHWHNMCVCVNVGSCNFRFYIYCSHLGFIKKWWFSNHRRITNLWMPIYFLSLYWKMQFHFRN